MPLAAKEYISDLNITYRYHPVIIIDNSPTYPINDYIPISIRNNIIDIDKPCAVNGLTLRKVTITFIDLNESMFDYLIPFNKDYYLELFSKPEIRNFNFIGERKNNVRVLNDLKIINNG